MVKNEQELPSIKQICKCSDLKAREEKTYTVINKKEDYVKRLKPWIKLCEWTSGTKECEYRNKKHTQLR